MRTRILTVALVLLPLSASAQMHAPNWTPRLTASVDVVQKYYDDGVTAVAYVGGWAVGNGVTPQRGVYVDGVYTGGPIISTERHDVCDRLAAWWGWACNATKTHCDAGPTPDGITDACVGVWMIFDISRLSFGKHVVQICAWLPGASTGPNDVPVCSVPVELVR